MAAPIIDEILAPTEVLTGDTFDAQVVAHDPDDRPGDVLFRVTDRSGQVAEVTWNVRVRDPVTYAAIDVNGFGWVIDQDANDPSIFHITAP